MNQKSADFQAAPAEADRPAAPLFYSTALPGGEIIRVDALREADAAAVAALERLHFQPAWSESQIARALGQERFSILGIRAAGQPAPPEKQTPFTPPAEKTALPVIDKEVAACRSRTEASGSGQTPEPLRGYISFYQTLDELEIVNIAVRSGQRRRGLGRALLEAAVQAGRQNGAARILLEVRESNAPAIALYEKCGFVQIGRRKGYYSDNNEDALLFELNLNGQ